MDEELPKDVGPHEERELELMLAGKKPLAMFNDDLPPGMEPPEVTFDPHVRAGRFIKRELVVSGVAGFPAGFRYYFFALPGEEWRIDRMIEINRGLFEGKVRTTPELETEIGRLLGYDEADIQVFLNRRCTIEE